MDRAVSLITITKADSEQRVFEGVASRPEVDRQGDIVEPLGAVFTLPLPLLHAHKHDAPIGWVEWAQAKADGIRFRARLAKVDEPGPLRDRLQTAWGEIKSGLIRAVSVGFAPLEVVPIATGMRFKKWTWYELSTVAVPACESATITAVKRLDRAALAAASPVRVVRLSAPTRKPCPVVRLNEPTTDKSARSIAGAIDAAMGKAVEEAKERAEEERRRKALGVGAQMALRAIAAAANATDAELAALRERLDRIERGNAQR